MKSTERSLKSFKSIFCIGELANSVNDKYTVHPSFVVLGKFFHVRTKQSRNCELQLPDNSFRNGA